MGKSPEEKEKAMLTIDYMLRCLAEDGGKIVSTNSLSVGEISMARDEDRMCVTNDGLGYVLVANEAAIDTNLRSMVMAICRLTLENMKLRGELQ